MITATATLILALPKTVLTTRHAKPHVGQLYPADTGVPLQLYQRLGLQGGTIFTSNPILSIA